MKYKDHPLNNYVIEIKSKEHSEQVMEYFTRVGIKGAEGQSVTPSSENVQRCLPHSKRGTFYGIINGDFRKAHNEDILLSYRTVMNLPTEEYLSQYPKIMLVSDNGVWAKRVVITEKLGRYICWKGVESFEEAELVIETETFKYAEELTERQQQKLDLLERAKTLIQEASRLTQQANKII